MHKSLFLFVLGLTIALNGCDDSDDDQNDPLAGIWNVINISGGLAGINDDYTQGTIVWSFDSTTSELTVTNNNTANTLYDGLDSGAYPYTILNAGNQQYLLINGQEFGGISLQQNQFTLDQNARSTGTGADGFIFLLEK